MPTLDLDTTVLTSKLYIHVERIMMDSQGKFDNTKLESSYLPGPVLIPLHRYHISRPATLILAIMRYHVFRDQKRILWVGKTSRNSVRASF